MVRPPLGGEEPDWPWQEFCTLLSAMANRLDGHLGADGRESASWVGAS